jgi:hypothetical protein
MLRAFANFIRDLQPLYISSANRIQAQPMRRLVQRQPKDFVLLMEDLGQVAK